MYPRVRSGVRVAVVWRASPYFPYARLHNNRGWCVRLVQPRERCVWSCVIEGKGQHHMQPNHKHPTAQPRLLVYV